MIHIKFLAWQESVLFNILVNNADEEDYIIRYMGQSSVFVTYSRVGQYEGNICTCDTYYTYYIIYIVYYLLRNYFSENRKI